MDVLEPIFSIPGKFSRKAFQFCLISYRLSVNVEVLELGWAGILGEETALDVYALYIGHQDK